MVTASQSVSMQYPKNEGTYDPNNEDDDDSKTFIVPETYIVKLVDEKVSVVAQEGIDWSNNFIYFANANII